ncbi:vacuolar transporter chaperone [Lunasporangiospora selenospora]|uniref:Vacuolar transporter chaperone n=1 Tax=Lunasporangiospora selenospora TaxID=979761 RepID=A0A9P6FUW9_9FUNG|nr:vacuolar transporter chaperone [Lunasporangiospora selenospora]
MKFGSQFKEHQAPHWRFYYVDYEGLKSHIRSNSLNRAFVLEDESRFVQLLNVELDKVFSFQAMKLGEIQRRTEHCELTIAAHYHSSLGYGRSAVAAVGSGGVAEPLTLSSFVETESEINKVTQDLQDLARFQRLNYTAFLKIIKKHDKHTTFKLRSQFMSQQLNSRPFHKESFAPLVSRLSTLFNIVRTGSAPAPSRASSIDSKDEDEAWERSRRSEGKLVGECVANKTAFWVHPDCVMDLKMLVLKYLPLVVYEPASSALQSPVASSTAAGSTGVFGSAIVGQPGSKLTSESPVSTVYLDNHDFDLYMAQAEQQDRVETFRLRWYGSDQKQMWVEHQQKLFSNQESNTGASGSSNLPASISGQQPTTTKHRFQIKSKYVPKLVQGTLKMDKAIALMRQSGQKTEAEIRAFQEATAQVQSEVKNRGLQPVVQTFFNRTAFQVPGDSRVRITIDTDIVMVRERRVQFSDLYDRPWSPVELRADDHPFHHIRDQDICRFPYAVMQIRTLSSAKGMEGEDGMEDIPSWVDQIAQSHLVERVHNFSKDQHAVATLCESRVGLLPFWLSDMDRDIRKPLMLTGGLQRRSDSNSNSGSNDTLTSDRSTVATSISDSGSPSSSTASRGAQGSCSSLGESKDKPSQGSKKARKSILDAPSVFVSPLAGVRAATPPSPPPPPPPPLGVTFHEQVEDLVANRKMLESQGVVTEAFDFRKNMSAKPIASCLKKTTSIGVYGNGESSPPSPSRSFASDDGYGSISARRHRATFENREGGVKGFLGKVLNWIPGRSQSAYADDLESQRYGSHSYNSFYNTGHVHKKSRTRSDNASQHANGQRHEQRRCWRFGAFLNRMFWKSLSVVNVVLMFVGLLLALMNLGDSVGEEAASLFLVVSCICMGTTVWAHLIRMDNQDNEDEERSSECIYTPKYVTHTDPFKSQQKQYPTSNERAGLLSGKYQPYDEDDEQLSNNGPSLAQKGWWIRTRLMPVVTFLCMGAAVALNVVVRIRALGEEIGPI